MVAPEPAFAGVVSGSFAERAVSGGGRIGSPDAQPASPLSRGAHVLGLIAVALLGLALVARAISVGRGPWGNMFEFTVAFGFTILAGYLILERRYPIRSIGFIPFGVALALLLYASSLPSEIKPLVPALQNAPLLTIHVGMATIAYGIFATSFAAGVGYLIQGTGDRFAWLPSHKVLDEVAYRAVIVGFPIFATMIILGSWWASIAWSRYWGWDPKETAALVTWLVYAVYLHARNQKAVGRPAGRAPARRRLRDGPGDLLRQPLVQRPARLLRPVIGPETAPEHPAQQRRPADRRRFGEASRREASERRTGDRASGPRTNGPQRAVAPSATLTEQRAENA